MHLTDEAGYVDHRAVHRILTGCLCFIGLATSSFKWVISLFGRHASVDRELRLRQHNRTCRDSRIGSSFILWTGPPFALLILSDAELSRRFRPAKCFFLPGIHSDVNDPSAKLNSQHPSRLASTFVFVSNPSSRPVLSLKTPITPKPARSPDLRLNPSPSNP